MSLHKNLLHSRFPTLKHEIAIFLAIISQHFEYLSESERQLIFEKIDEEFLRNLHDEHKKGSHEALICAQALINTILPDTTREESPPTVNFGKNVIARLFPFLSSSR